MLDCYVEYEIYKAFKHKSHNILYEQTHFKSNQTMEPF